MTNYEPTNEELVDFEESLIRAHGSVEKGNIGKEKLKEMWKRKQKETEVYKKSRELRLNLIRDVFPGVEEGVHQNFLSKSGNAQYMMTWLEIIAQIEMRKVKALEKIAQNI